MLVIDIYNKAEWEVTDDEAGKKRKGLFFFSFLFCFNWYQVEEFQWSLTIEEIERLIDLLREFPPDEPTRKRFINETIGWSSKYGDIEQGDPELHHAAGTIFAQGMALFNLLSFFVCFPDRGLIQCMNIENEPYDAERHLSLGTADSAEVLGRLEYDWYTYDEPHTAGIYASRAVFPYLLTGNLRNANKAFLTFTSRLSSASNQSLPVQEVSSKSADMRVYPSLPLLNFVGLLLLGTQRGSPDLFKQLCRQYAQHLREIEGLETALAHIGEIYFGVKIPRQSNPLMDMMGMMFGGGGGGGGSGAGGQRSERQSKGPGQVTAPPPSMDLD